ncbi:MAG: DUF3857 and transglutaminase domain-containing protein [Opitutaceae bacterium]|nr:DUF3857 and transglutaminase domain-containing protein [Opitutaceae bacterium]
MRFVAPLLAAALLAVVTPLHAASTTEVSRTPPPVYADRLAGLLTPLAEVMDGRTAFPGEDGGGVVLLHERVYFHGDDGLVYRLIHVAQFAADQSGVDYVGNDIFTFDRDREDIFLIDAASVRADGERIPVEGKGAFIQTPQREADNSLYTSEAELNVIYPHVAPGSVTEAIVLVRENQPVMPGEFAYAHTFSRGWPAHRQRLVLDFPSEQLERIRAVTTGSGVPEPLSERYADGRERRTWSRTAAPYVPWEENGPQYEYRGPTLWLTTLESWDAVAAWFHGLVRDRSELGPALEAEVDRWTEGLTSRTEVLARLTEKVANDVRYVGLEFGLAGYQPHPCREVWEARYGDCKDKANLLRAMLAHKGISAHVVLLQTSGLGRVQVDSPSWRQFNHAILAVEDGAGGFTFCDPTIKYLPAGSVGLSDLARDVLVVREGRAIWARTPDALDAAIRVSGDLVLAEDGALSGWFTLAGEGSDAAGYANYLNSLDRDGRLRWMQRLTAGFFPGADVVDIDYTPVEGSVRRTSIRAYFVRGARASGDQALVFPYPADWLPSVETRGDRRFPYVTRRREESVAVTIALPEGWGAPGVPDAFSAPSAVADFGAEWSIAPGRLGARLAWHPKQVGLAATDYPVLQRSIRSLTAWLEQPVVLQRTATASTQPAPGAAADLSDFPILPTGQGQLRLLNERYPEKARPVQRRAGLEKILQWFPNDTETVFEARIWLASLDWTDTTNREFADRASELLGQYAGRISPGLRAWGVYLEAKARWEADKDPAAIDRLEQVADDKTLTAYRRGWAAVFAARYRRESDAARALEFLLRHDDYDSEARETIVELISGMYAQIGDTEGAGAWARQFASAEAETSDGMLAAALDTLIAGDALIPPGHRTAVIGAILAAVPADEAHPKVAAVRQRWEPIAAQQVIVAGVRRHVAAWLEQNRPEWWTPGKMETFGTMAALEKHLSERDDARDGPGTVDGAMQLILHHEPDVPTLAKYARWSMWWLRKNELSPGLVDVLGRQVLALSPEAGEPVIQAWQEYAAFTRAGGRLDEARAIYARVLEQPAAKNYQVVGAGGELGLLELGAGRVDEALAAFHRIVPVHTDHKWSVDYLYPAVLLHVGRGEYDQALALIEDMRRQETQYIDGSDHKIAVKILLRTAKQPDALRRYWERTAAWIDTWYALLDLNGIPRPALHELPLETDFTALGARIDKAVATKNIAAYLREMDTYARLARVIPMFGSDFSTQVDKSGRISSAFAQRIYTVGLGLLDGAGPVDPEFDNSGRVWRCVMLSGVGRHKDAAAAGRALYEDLGTSDPQGMAGLRVWVVASRGQPDESEAVTQLELALAGLGEVPHRMMSVRILSDTYWLGKDAVSQRRLLDRETVRSDFERTSDIGKILLERLEGLKKEAHASGELTAAIETWFARQDAGWLEHVPPATLDDRRFAAFKAPLVGQQEGVSSAEVLKFNVLSAREEALPAETRVGAFASAVIALAFQTNDVERLTDTYLSASALTVLPDERRARLVYSLVSYLAGRGETRLLERAVADPSFAFLAEARADSTRACVDALKRVEAGGADAEVHAFALLNAAPLDGIRVECVRHLVERLATAGEFGRASALIAAAKDARVDPTAGQSLATLRLGWTRSVRRAQDQRSFAAGLRDILVSVPVGNDPVPDKVRRQVSFGYSHRLTAEEHFSEAVWVIDHGYLAGEAFAAAPLGALYQAQLVRAKNPTLAPRILELALMAPGTDADRAQWVMGAGALCDIDRPEILARVLAAAEQFRNSPEAASRPQTARSVALLCAYAALRTGRDARPAAIFDEPARQGVSENERRGIELHFLLTRGQAEEGLRVAETLSPEVLMQPHLFRVARNGLLAAGHAGEVELLDEAMREQLGRVVGELWMNPDALHLRSWLPVARVLGAGDVLTDAWFERAVGTCATDLDRGMLRAQQALLRQDWKALRDSCDTILREVPDMYDAYYDRAIARHYLGDRDGARDDLRVVLRHALSNEDYQHAVALFRELAPGEKIGP